MAGDGGGNGGSQYNVGFNDLFPYLPNMAGRKGLRVAAGGHCDTSMGDVRERLSPLRETLLAFRGTIAAAGSPIVIAGAQEITAFSNGVGDDGAPLGLTGILTRAETNTQPKGGLVQQDQSFITVGCWAQFVEPWTVATGASLLGSVDAASPRNYRAFMRSPVSPYNRVVLQAIAESCSFQLRNGPATACQFDLGPLSLAGQAAGAADAKNGLGGIPGAFFYLSTPDVSGGTQSGKELAVQLRNERQITIENDAANPTAQCDVAVALRIVFVGYPVCNEGAVGGGVSLEDAQAMADAAAEKAVQRIMSQNAGRMR